MAISIAQYVDLLFKKLQGVAKTANSATKSASNESIASPAFLRGDVVWMQADQITATAGAIAGISNARVNSNSVQCLADTTVPPVGGIRPTWLSNVSYWIPQEFGSTWLPKVYVGPASAANIQATGTQIFSAGIGGVGEYYFDTQAGVLNFIGETIPTVLTAGNVVYISGYEYVGAIGVTNNPGNVTIGNLTVANTTVSTVLTDGNITLTATGNGLVAVTGVSGLTIPAGNTDQRPTSPATGTVRFNTFTQNLETYTGNSWAAASSGGNSFTITNQTIIPDGSSLVYPLNQTATSSSVLLTINGVNQTPDMDYSVVGNSLTMSTVPEDSDWIQVRFLSGITTTTTITNSVGNAVVSVSNSGNIDLQPSPAHVVNVDGNIVANYFIGNGSQLTGIGGTYGNADVVTLLSAFGSNSISTTGNITSGNVSALNFNSTSADLAEKYTSDQAYPPGTVLVFGGTSQVTACVDPEDHRAAGVVSTLPAYLMNTELPDVTVAVALAGQVPCCVVGPVAKGDVLTTSTVAGHAKTLDFSLFRPGCVIGKALEDCGPGLHKILIFVSHG